MLAKKISLNFFFTILNQVVSFLASIFVARFGGAAIFGNISLATSYQGLFKGIISSSINNAHFKVYAEKNNVGTKNFAVLSLFLFTFSDLLVLLWALYNYFAINPVLSNLQMLLIILFVGQDLITIPTFITSTHLVAKLEIKKSNILNFIPLFLANILKIIAVVIGFKEIGIAISMLIASFIGTLYSLKYVKDLFKGQLDFRTIKKYIKLAAYISTGALANTLLMNYDKILLSFIGVSPEKIGYYNAGNKLGLMLMILGTSVGGIFMAVFSQNASENNNNNSINQLISYERYILLFFMPFIVILMIIGEDLLKLLFGDGFETGYLVLNMSLIAAVLKTLTIPYHNFLFANSKYKKFNFLSLSYSFLIVLLTTLLGVWNPFNDVLCSISLGLLISGTLEKVFFTYASKGIDKRIRIFYHSAILIYFSIIYIIGYTLFQYLILEYSIWLKFIFVLVYFTLSILVGFFIKIYNKNDLRLIKQIVKKQS